MNGDKRAMLRKWGFIYTLDGDATEWRRDVAGTPACELVCLGVPRVEDGPMAGRHLIEEGAQLIELCGAFAGVGLAAVVDAVDGKVPVGAVFYGGDAAGGLNELFG